MKSLYIDGQEYEVVPDEARVLTEYLFTLRDRLGVPQDLTNDELTPQSWFFIEQIISAWKTAYPEEHRDWIENLEFDLKYERPIANAVKAGGWIPISYPTRVYQLIKIFLPNIKMNDKKFTKTLVQRIPEFKHTNYAI